MRDYLFLCLNYTIKQAQYSSNMNDVSYLQGLTDKIKNGEMVTPRNYVIKYGGSSRRIEEPNANIDILFSSEYNLLDVIRYNYGIGYSQNMLVKNLLKKPLPDMITKLELPVYFVMGKLN